MFIQRSMRNLNAAKRSSYQTFFFLFCHICASVWLRQHGQDLLNMRWLVTFHTLNISYLKVLPFIFKNKFVDSLLAQLVQRWHLTLSNIHCLNRVTVLCPLPTLLFLVSSTCLFVSLSVCLSVCMYVCMYVCMSVCQIRTYVIGTYVLACVGT